MVSKGIGSRFREMNNKFTSHYETKDFPGENFTIRNFFEDLKTSLVGLSETLFYE